MVSTRRSAALLAPLLLAACGTNDALHGRIRTTSADLALARGTTPRTPEQLGMLRFLYDDLGGLRIENGRGTALPWKVLVAALVRDRTARLGTPTTQAQVTAAFAEFGFVSSDSIANWRGPQPARVPGHPIGIVTGTADYRLPSLRVEIANISCGACHVGFVYDSTGAPTRTAWVGMANTSIDVSGFSSAVYRNLKVSRGHDAAFLATIDTLFPDLSGKERHTLQKYVLPEVAKRITELAAGVDAPIPYYSGGPGQANPVVSMRYQLGLIPKDSFSHATGYSSIPDLAYRHLRSGLLYDGGYAIPGHPRQATLTPVDATDEHLLGLARIASVFSVSVMGVRIEDAPRNVPQLNDMLHFIRSYRPPPFPGHIDARLADDGRGVYAARCAGCHGTVSEGEGRPEIVSLPNRLVPVNVIGTDGRRAAESDSSIAAALRAGYSRLAEIDSTGMYVAPPLAGVWATAPYLHNGSVPTLWHLMHPDQRPARFYVGGHRIDFVRVGIAGEVGSDGTMRYPSDYRPWSTPRLLDTSEPGRSNRGHETMFANLSEAQKTALLEYLKRL
jgi:mono/diheme cytochrome c family protein